MSNGMGTKSDFAMIEFMAIQELDPFELKLYAHYKKRAFELRKDTKTELHEIWIPDSVRELATGAKMSPGKAGPARNRLRDLGYLEIETFHKNGTQLVTGSRARLVDRWADNAAAFGRSYSDHREGLPPEGRSPDDHARGEGRSPGDHGRSYSDHHHYIRDSRSDSDSMIESSSNESSPDDDATNTLKHAAELIGLIGDPLDSLLELERADGLALIWTAQQRGRTNPAGLLASMLRGGQRPDPKLIELAGWALENQITTEHQARAERNAALFAAHTDHQVDQVPERTPAAAGRDFWESELARIHDKPLTFRSWWGAIISTQPAAAAAEVIDLAGDVLTLSAPAHMHDRTRDQLQRSFSRYGRVVWADADAVDESDAASVDIHEAADVVAAAR